MICGVRRASSLCGGHGRDPRRNTIEQHFTVLFFGQAPAELRERAQCSVLFLASEPPTQEPEPRKGSVPASKVSVVNH